MSVLDLSRSAGPVLPAAGREPASALASAVRCRGARPPGRRAQESREAREQARLCERLDRGGGGRGLPRRAGPRPRRRSGAAPVRERPRAAPGRARALERARRPLPRGRAARAGGRRAWLRLGSTLLFALNETAEALAALEEAVRLAPADASARVALALARARPGRYGRRPRPSRRRCGSTRRARAGGRRRARCSRRLRRGRAVAVSRTGGRLMAQSTRPRRSRRSLLAQLDEAFDRRSWHGTNLRGSLRGITGDQALAPGPGRHNVWEIALHAAYWKYAAWRRLTGEKRGRLRPRGQQLVPEPGAAHRGGLARRTWPCSAATTGAARGGGAARRRRPRAPAPGGQETIGRLVRGIAAHDLYHAGQIQLIKRLAARLSPGGSLLDLHHHVEQLARALDVQDERLARARARRPPSAARRGSAPTRR